MSAIKLPGPGFAAPALLALAAALLPGGLATAQPRPAANLPNLKMFRPLKAAPAAPATAPHVAAATYAAPPSPTTPPPVQVTLTFPTLPDTAFAAIRGPDGEVRYFPIEGGRKELGTRVIVVRPGERVHIQLPPPKPR
jgi:hypothetical protein